MIFRVLAAILVLLPTLLTAEQNASPLHRLISKHQNHLYVIGERTGGSPDEWLNAEATILASIRTEISANPQSLTLRNKKGDTPLITAAGLGYAGLVEELLSHDAVKAEIDATDQNDMNAYDAALLSSRASLLACHPTLENPFAFVPFMVTLPYYHDRDPYPRIAKALIAAGAKASDEKAKSRWLESCSNTDPAARKAVADSDDLIQTLDELNRQALARKTQGDRDQIDEQVKILREIFGPRVKSGEMKAEELENLVAGLYRQAGFEPPAKEDAK